MADENQVEQTTETKETEQPVEQPTETVNAHTFSEEDVNNIVKQRLAKERASIFKKLDVDLQSWCKEDNGRIWLPVQFTLPFGIL